MTRSTKMMAMAMTLTMSTAAFGDQMTELLGELRAARHERNMVMDELYAIGMDIVHQTARIDELTTALSEATKKSEHEAILEELAEAQDVLRAMQNDFVSTADELEEVSIHIVNLEARIARLMTDTGNDDPGVD